MLSTFRKLLAKEESANKPDVLTSIRCTVTLVAIFLLFWNALFVLPIRFW